MDHQCGNCGRKVPQPVEKCYECREQDAMAKAEVVENEFGFFIVDRYYDDVEDLEGEYLPGHAPERAWAAEPTAVPQIDIDDDLYNWIDRIGFDTEETKPEKIWDGIEELRKAVAEFNDKNKEKTYLTESNKVVLIPAPYSDAETADVTAVEGE
jgi:hypothetical protein